MDYSWPGNVRELKNIIERAVLLTDTSSITPEHLPDKLRGGQPAPASAAEENQALSIEGYTKSVILKYQENMTEQKIADLLGITRKSLWEKRKKWQIKRNE
jgi:transcriptional regulator with PAS, ATPase and Fis domain